MCLNYTCKCNNSERAAHPKVCYGLAEHAGNGQVDASGCCSPFPRWLTWASSFAKIPGYVFVVPVPGSRSGFFTLTPRWTGAGSPSATVWQRLQHSFNFSHACCPSEIKEGYSQASLHAKVLSSGLPLSRKLSRVWTASLFLLAWCWEQMPYRVWAQYRIADLTWDQYAQSRSRGASLLEICGGLVCAWDLKSCWKLMKLILLNAQAILSSRI